jgi:Flp pilus assembly protein TadG
MKVPSVWLEGVFVREEGNAMVEFAIAATVFISLLLGIIGLGYAAWTRNSVASGAREGARFAIVRGTSSGRVTDSAGVADYVKSKTPLDANLVVITRWSPNKEPGSLVTVTVKHPAPAFGPFLGARTDSASSTMVVVY